MVGHLVLPLSLEELRAQHLAIIILARREYLSLSLGKLGLRVAQPRLARAKPHQVRLFFLVGRAVLAVLEVWEEV
jgi:hypothetical protein